MARALHGFVDLAGRYGAGVTLPVPAVVLARHPALLTALQGDAGAVELAVHGNRHVDHSLLSSASLTEEIQRARATFAGFKLPFSGFRAPYLRWSAELLHALAETSFAYDGSRSVIWPVVDTAALNRAQETALKTLLDFDRPDPTEMAPALPYWIEGLLEIPVSFPDDELLVERLRLRDPKQIAAHWIQAFDQCHARGELFVLQLHPERFQLCAAAVELLLQHVQALGPAVWRASLRDVTAWWQEKQAFSVSLASAGDRRWAASLAGSERAALLWRGAGLESAGYPIAPGMFSVPGGRGVGSAARRPCVGLSPRTAPALARYLADAGYVVEADARPERCVIHLDRPDFAPDAAAPLLAGLAAAEGPLVQIGRWPHAAQSALVLSGDVDAITLWDYALRLVGR